MPGDFLKTVLEAVKSFGWAGGTLIVFFWVAHFVYYKLTQARLHDRQEEIDRLAADNHAYRDRWLALHDKQHGYTPPQQPSLPPARKKGKKGKGG